jgi:hypothetical protein
MVGALGRKVIHSSITETESMERFRGPCSPSPVKGKEQEQTRTFFGIKKTSGNAKIY